MQTISMGLNTEPDFLKADEVIERWQDSGNAEMVTYWRKAKKKSLELRDKIIEAVERDGECELNWTCMGETRFQMHANQWKKALPQYNFTIGRYLCIVRKPTATTGSK